MFTVTLLYVEAMDREAPTFDDAVELGKRLGFSFIVTRGTERLASWCPIGGLRDYRATARPALRIA